MNKKISKCFIGQLFRRVPVPENTETGTVIFTVEDVDPSGDAVFQITNTFPSEADDIFEFEPTSLYFHPNVN
jgi:hypothetical protein